MGMRKTVLLVATKTSVLLLVSGVAYAITKDCRAGADLCLGTNGADTLNGSDVRDKIHGKDGNDLLLGNKGDDTLSGGKDDDTIRGGPGRDDTPFSGLSAEGIDEIYGGDGNDYLLDFAQQCDVNNFCVDDPNLLSGQGGDDHLEGGNRLSGGSGDDYIAGNHSGGKRRISGGKGNDRILSRGPADDTIYVRDGMKDTVRCMGGEDTVYFDKGMDSLSSNCEHRVSD
jgi:Ca2+-binding RTX toxin-like protein